jgi:hypothetical protein
MDLKDFFAGLDPFDHWMKAFLLNLNLIEPPMGFMNDF